MKMQPRFAELGVDEAGFIGFLKVMFAQKRKTVSNNLKLAYDKGAAKAALTHTGIAPTMRAETIALEDMARLYLTLKDQALKNRESNDHEVKRVNSAEEDGSCDEHSAGSGGGRTVLSEFGEGTAERSAGFSGTRRPGCGRPRGCGRWE